MMRIEGCEVCGNAILSDVLDLGEHPLCDDLVPVGTGPVAETYPIVIAFCSECKTAHQKYQVPKRLLFPETYHYRARHTADVINGMRQLVQRCEQEVGSLKGLTVVDIGCNDGSLLSIFAEYGAKTVGIEPTGAAKDAQVGGHRVYQDYLSPVLAADLVAEHGKPDIVTFTNVFAHIENLPEVLAAAGSLMGPKTLLVIENHYLGAVLDRYQFDTFYHEHPRTYSLASFQKIAESLGGYLAAAEFPARYGGNIRVMMRVGAKPWPETSDPVTKHVRSEADFEARLRDMGQRIPRWQSAKRAQIAEMVKRHGPLPAKAFPGRAAILVKLLDLDETMISAAYEKPGSMKIGHYIPGTRIPIQSDDAFASRPSKEAPLINLAWHISSEIGAYMRKQGFDGPIVDIFSVEEFDRFTR